MAEDNGHVLICSLLDLSLAISSQQLYDCSGRERKAMIPGGDDTYRKTRFSRDDDNQTYKVRYSEMSSVQLETK